MRFESETIMNQSVRSSFDWPFFWPSDERHRGPVSEQAPIVATAAEARSVGGVDGSDPPAAVDRLLHAGIGRLTGGVSPIALSLAYMDWVLHLWVAPGKCEELAEKALRKALRLGLYVARCAADPSARPCIEPLPQDQRFRNEAWRRWPFNFYSQAFLLNQQWWHSATTGVAGVSLHHEQVVSFMTRQLLDVASPVNFIATNPEVIDATIRESGMNLSRGVVNCLEDWERAVGGKPPVGVEAFEPGGNVAVTPGRVVLRNRLTELIQYAPTTNDVFAEPILIVPAWIMKYYILDLSPYNSLVKYLVDRGHTVFMISWRNPRAEDRDLGMDDYLRLGVLDALEKIRTITPQQRINAVGYCLGGTLLSIAAAYLGGKGHSILNSVTLLAAQTDFTEAGELTLFIDESQLGFLDDIMWSQGVLEAKQMAGTFQFLRSSDLIWSRAVQGYLMGLKPQISDLMAWNADATRMPYRMHSQYLRRLFLDNDLFEGRYKVDERPVALSDIRVPLFVVATEFDHVAPWRSVYKINLVSDAEVAFVLTSGGHNAGIVSEPGHKNRHYRISRSPANAHYVDPELWFEATPIVEGSWWPTWAAWLEERSKMRMPPPLLEASLALGAAPGRYVLER
jgi:polyhydroxyalkanoate synthase